MTRGGGVARQAHGGGRRDLWRRPSGIGWFAYWFIVPLICLLFISPSLRPPLTVTGNEGLAFYVTSVEKQVPLNMRVTYHGAVQFLAEGTVEIVTVAWESVEETVVPKSTEVYVYSFGDQAGGDGWACQSGVYDTGALQRLSDYPTRAPNLGISGWLPEINSSAVVEVDNVREPAFLPESISVEPAPEAASLQYQIANDLPDSKYSALLVCERTAPADISTTATLNLRVPRLTLWSPAIASLDATARFSYNSGWPHTSKIVGPDANDVLSQPGYVLVEESESRSFPTPMTNQTVLSASFEVANPDGQRTASALQQAGLLALGAWLATLVSLVSRDLTEWPWRRHVIAEGAGGPGDEVSVASVTALSKSSAVSRTRGLPANGSFQQIGLVALGACLAVLVRFVSRGLTRGQRRQRRHLGRRRQR